MVTVPFFCHKSQSKNNHFKVAPDTDSGLYDEKKVYDANSSLWI